MIVMRSILLVFAALAVAFLPTSVVAAASPSASGAPPGPTPDTRFESWLDEPLPPDVPVGRTLTIGLTIWDTAQKQLFDVNTLTVRVEPRTGTARATTTTARSDWPGHLVADITIPKGGLGRIVAGTEDQTCDAAGACQPLFQPFTIGGVGPPPDAPRSMLLTAAVDRIPQPVTAGLPFAVGVAVAPRADWGVDMLGLPDHLVALVQLAAGGDVGKADLTQVGTDLRYSGQVTPTIAGDAVLTVGVPRVGGPEDIIPSSKTPLRIRGGATSPSPTTSDIPPARSSDVSPIVPVLVGLAVVIGGLVLVRALRDR
jgi:hypothetical protein